jgi:uncharacterized protein with NRDE domain
MCTLTYIPKGRDEFILTHNRDESVRRPIASPPINREINGVEHIFPVDPKGMGTWIGISKTNRIACLLNGGLKKHKHKPPYRHSRGLVVLDYFRNPSFEAFYKTYQFNGLEPFTMIVYENGKLIELIHDEQFIRVKNLDPAKPHIYSSTPLYSKENMMIRREKLFSWYYQNAKINQNEIVNLHKSFLYELENNKLPVNEIIRTVSITSIDKLVKKADVAYIDMINDVHLKKSMRLSQVGQLIEDQQYQ